MVSVATPYAAGDMGRTVIPRWPEGVKPEETSPKILNPEYIKKQEALQEAELQLHRQARLEKQYRKWTRGTTFTQNKNNRRTWKKIRTLSKELSQTPKYITASDQPDKPVKE
jgi:hypothetical protein